MLPEFYSAEPIKRTPYDDVFYFIREPANGPRANHYTFLDRPKISVLCPKSADGIQIRILRSDKRRQKVREGYGDMPVTEIQLSSLPTFASIVSVAIESRHEREKLENIVGVRRTSKELLNLSKDELKPPPYSGSALSGQRFTKTR